MKKGSQHFGRTGPSRWRSINHCTHDNLQQDLADRRMANSVDQVFGHHTCQERQPATVAELPVGLISHPSSHAEDHTEQIDAASGEDHCWITGRLQNRKEHQQQIFSLRILCEKHLQHQQTSTLSVEGFQQGLACSFVNNNEKVQYERQPYPTPLWQAYHSTSAVLFSGSLGDWF